MTERESRITIIDGIEHTEYMCPHGVWNDANCSDCAAAFEAWWTTEQTRIATLPICLHTWPENPQGMYHCPECGSMTLGEQHHAGYDQ